MVLFMIIWKFLVRCLNENKQRFVEGEMRCKQLAEYLAKLGAVKRIWISEDATAITSTVKYDPNTNQLVGLVLPINAKNGCPIMMSYEAKDEATIREHLNLPRTNSVYVVMAQSLDETIPPFVPQLYGTNGKFKGSDVVKRWATTKDELKLYVLIISS